MPNPPHDREFGGPHNQCYSGSMGQGLTGQSCDGNDVTIDMGVDRRVIEVVMVDCEAELNCDGCSNKDFDAEGFVQMFILGPWAIDGAGNSAKHEIYAEIIGPVTKDIEKSTAVEIVQLYE